MFETAAHPILHDIAGDNGADDPGDGADGVGDTHEDGGILGRDVEVVDAEPGPGEPAAAEGERDAGDGRAAVEQEGREGHEDRLAEVRRAREELPDLQGNRVGEE